MWWRRSWFSLKGKAGIPGQTEGRPATSIGPRVPPMGSLQQRGRGAKLVSLMDNIDTGTATGKMVMGVLAVLAEFERNLLMERCAAGVKIARQRKVRFGRPPKLTPSLIRQVVLAHDDASTTVPETCRVLGISKSSYYAALREGRRQALETAEAA